MTQISLAILTPAYGGFVSAEHQRMFLHLGNQLGGSAERFKLAAIGVVDVNPVDRARNKILQEAKERGATWVLMIDADTWVVDDGEDDAGYQLLRMISAAEKLDAAIVIAPVRRRRTSEDNPELMAYSQPLDGGKPFSISAVERLGGIVDDGLIQIDSGATAVMAINLAKIGNELGSFATFRFTDQLSEDLEFCRQVRVLGGKIYVDTRVRTAHLSRPFPLLSKGER